MQAKSCAVILNLKSLIKPEKPKIGVGWSPRDRVYLENDNYDRLCAARPQVVRREGSPRIAPRRGHSRRNAVKNAKYCRLHLNSLIAIKLLILLAKF